MRLRSFTNKRHGKTFNRRWFMRGVASVAIVLATMSLIHFESDLNALESLARRMTTMIGNKRRLEFVHITNEGGSAIEAAGAAAGVNWGACHYVTNRAIGCLHPDIEFQAPKNYESFIMTSPWHLPPKLAVLNPKLNPYEDAALFTVVRNPYSRYLSEFYCPFTGFKEENIEKVTADDLNNWIQDKLQKIDSARANFDYSNLKDRDIDKPFKLGEKPSNNKAKSDNGLLAQKHFVPQVEYVFDDDGSQIIDHILYYENLREDFDDLMLSYDMNARLPDVNLKQAETKLSHLDLYPETIAMINKLAGDDFRAFGYTMVDTFEGKSDYSLRAHYLLDKRLSEANGRSPYVVYDEETREDNSPPNIADNSPSQKRPIMHTFYQPDKAGEPELLQVWREEWSKAGFEPVVLSLDDAKNHPYFEDMRKMVEPVFGAGYNALCMYRWLAMSSRGGGWMSDYDAFPTHFPIEDALTLPNNGEFSSFEGVVPSLVAGTAEEWTRVAMLLTDAFGRVKGFKSDMYAFELLQLEQRDGNDHRIHFETDRPSKAVLGQVALGFVYEKPRVVKCDVLKNTKITHISHAYTTDAEKKGVFPIENPGPGPVAKHRAKAVRVFLKDFREQCALEKSQEDTKMTQ